MNDTSTSTPDDGGTDRPPSHPFHAQTLAASLTVQDLASSLRWYRDVIGFEVDQRHERDGQLRAVSLRAGDVRILIGQDDGAKGWDRTKGEGFSLHFTTSQNVDDIAHRVREHGHTLDTEPTDMPWGARVFRVLDPDGFKLAVSSVRGG